MGQSACSAGKDAGCSNGACGAGAGGKADMPSEYEPKSKAEVVGECVEPDPPLATALRKDRNATDANCGACGDAAGGVNAAGSADDGSTESYFAREVAELRALPNDGSSGARKLHSFKSGATYLGEWKGNARHGIGKQCWEDGASFYGRWVNNFAEGHGEFQHADGDVFIGQWRGNSAQGLGIYYHKKGLTTYVGQWVEDLQHGSGVERWDGGSTYSGQFVWGKKHGCGVYQWPDASSYSGEWHSNSINGLGHYVGKDGREFRGIWKEAVIHGCGKYSWPDGRTFCGQYVADRKQGFGIFAWKDARRFEGYWDQGKQHGHGIMRSVDDKIMKEGLWVKGQAPEAPEDAPEVQR